MAARRLLILMVILLGISTLLAAALPDRVRDAEEEQGASETVNETATPTETTAESGSPKLCEIVECRVIDADEPKISVIPLEAGDQLVLRVDYSKSDFVEIEKLGFIDFVGPDNPATFDVLADRVGDYGISLVEAGRPIGRLQVTQPAPEPSKPASAGDPP